MTPEDQLRTLGLELPDPPLPVGADTLATRTTVPQICCRPCSVTVAGTLGPRSE